MSNDGRFAVDVPSGAVSSAQVAADGGNTSLVIRQILPASGSNAGGSGEYSFGTYLIQVVDASGNLANHGLTQPATLSLHYGNSGSSVDVTHAFAVVNGALPACVNLDPIAALAPLGTSSTSVSSARTSNATPSPSPSPATVGTLAHPATRVDPNNGMLVTTTPFMSSTTSVSWGTNSPVATFGRPDPFEVNLSGGSLTTGYNIDVPAGPSGFKPPLSLIYNSAGVSDQHNPMGAAPWVGEGWNMNLGQISWSESNVQNGVWENRWQLDDAYGTSAELIPPTTTTSIYNDHSGNPISSSVLWHTAPETFAKIYSFQNANLQFPNMPCFRVFLTNGIMEEFGCTQGSIQYYSDPNTGTTYIANWLLDLVTDPSGNQIQITYQADDVIGYGQVNYPRDIEMATVEWDSPTCQNAQTGCNATGTAPNLWAPLMRVSFSASHTVNRTLGSSCPPIISARCDDSLDLSSTGGLAAPKVESTFVLNDILVQVRASGTASWNTLRDYQLSYDQTAPTTITDPVSGLQESTAGKFNLTQLGVVGDDSTTPLPTTTFAYWTNTTAQTESYIDTALRPNPGTNCGPAWNTGCYLWSQSYQGNSSYLESASNGLGLAQTFTWMLARNNTHGVVEGGAPTSTPWTCDATYYINVFPCTVADDGTWSRTFLVQRTDSVLRNSTTPVTSTTSYSYQLSYPLANQKCPDCVAGYSWGNQDDVDYLDFYNGKFLGFAQTTVNHPDGSLEVHKFWSTEGWGLYDTAQVSCTSSYACHKDPWWDFSQISRGQNNVAHGNEYEVDSYDTNGTTLLKQVKTGYSILCPPTGVSGSPPVTGQGNWNGNLVSALDHGNPMGACSTRTQVVDTYTFDGATSGSPPHSTASLVYDSYGRVIKETDISNDGGANGSPTTIVHQPAYVWKDLVSASSSSVTGTYLINLIAFDDTENTTAPASRYQCSYTRYDGLTNLTGSQPGLTRGLVSRVDDYTGCGTSGNGYTPTGQISRTYVYDSYGNLVATKDPDANAGNATHVGCVVSGTAYSTCTTYDSTFYALAISHANALNQVSTINYQAPAGGTAASGFGLWPISTSDVNNQSTSYGYDPLSRLTSHALPGEGTGLNTVANAYTVWCSGTAAQTPCAEIDTTQRLNGSTTVTSRAFYDGLGHLAETRSPAPNGQDIVQYAYYDPSQRLIFESVPYFVAAYTGGPGAPAYSTPDTSQAGTSYAYDGIGRTTSVTDALSHRTSTVYTAVCNAAGTGDTACYEQVMATDPLGHQAGALIDSFARTNYEQRYTGNSPASYAVYATTKYTYDYLGDLTQIRQPNGTSLTTYSYDMAGRQTGMTDSDRGSETYTYDQDGNLIQSTDARGSAGTVYAGFDGVDRPVWRNSSNTPTGAYDTYSYDNTTGGNIGVGRLTSETFSGSPNNSLSGSYGYTYDVRGRPTAATLTIGSTSYPLQATYDDAGSVLTQTYPNGETVTNSYTGPDWLSGVSTSQGNTALMSAAAYTGIGGANGFITSASLAGNTYQYSAGFDLLGRATDLNVKRSSDQAVMFDQARTFDASGNVSTIGTTLQAGTDNQAFCYDEQNRLTWAGSTGTPPCTGTAISAGTLTSAQYTQSFVYDNMGRLTSGPLGAYTYGSTHVHAATAIGSSFTAAYDPAGDMTCRAPLASSTCSGTQTGAQLTFNNEGQLSNWQNQPSSPTSAASFLYDGQGNRVVQQATSAGSTTTTVYAGNVEEDATTGSTTTKTSYYYANGRRIALAVNGSFSYLASDGLGSANVSLDAGGNVTAGLLYAPYGSARYSSGTMPTKRGFTGQIADSTSGLDYYGARYYDPVAAQFTSADTTIPGGGFDIWGLSRYAYVAGNPVVYTDPTGRDLWCECSDAVGNTGNPPAQQSQSTPPKPINPNSPAGQVINWAASQFESQLTSYINSAKVISKFTLDSFGGWAGWEQDALSSGDPLQVTLGVVGVTSLFIGGPEIAAGKDVLVAGGEQALSHAQALNAGDHAVSDLAETCAINSFSAGTLVLMANGSKKPIEQLKTGDRVMAGDPQKGTEKPEPIQRVIVGKGLKHLYDIHVAGGVIEATYNHPFWVVDKQSFVWAQDLQPGEHLLLADGRAPPIDAVSHHDEVTTVYNLSIRDVHTFYVGAPAALVHNSCGDLKDVLSAWSKSTFPNRPQSIAYHLGEHGGGRSALNYTNDALDFLAQNQGRGKPFITRAGEAAERFSGNPGGIFTTDGRIVTFWDN